MEITGVASLLHDGRRVPLDGEATLGRADDNTLVVADERASRRHARVFAHNGGYAIADLGSRHGTFVNGDRCTDEPRLLEAGDAIEVGDQLIRFLSGEHTRMASREQEIVAVQTVDFAGKRLTLGRDQKNGVVLGDPNVSRFHAELVRHDDGSVELVDLGSRNGTRLNGELTGGGRVERRCRDRHRAVPDRLRRPVAHRSRRQRVPAPGRQRRDDEGGRQDRSSSPPRSRSSRASWWR